MQTLEAILSFMFLLAIVSSMLSSFYSAPLDDSLYRIQLAQDAWRVLYIRGDFHDYSDVSDSKRASIEKDLDTLGNETGLCFFLEGVRITDCRGAQSGREMIVVLHETLIMDNTPKNVTFSISNQGTNPAFN